MNLSISLLLAALPLAATAQTTPEATPLPSAATAAAPAPLSYYGFVDGYYGYDFDYANGNERPGFIFSHSRQNEFMVNQALVGIRYDDGTVRGTVGLHTGSYPAANYSKEDQVFRHIYEAYAGFRPFARAWLDFGVFGSHLGFESALSKDNWTLTRSLNAENSPYFETGARFTYELDPRLTLTGLVLNGWQNIRETNQAKALGTQIQWKPSDRILINSSTFYGNEQPEGTLLRRRYFHDFYITYAASARTSLALVFDVGKQRGVSSEKYDTWHTASVFIKQQLADKFSATLRGEYYYAERGVIIRSISPTAFDADFRVAGGSLNLDYLPTSNVAFRVEGRYLNGMKGVFARRNNPDNRSYGNVTTSVALSF